MKIVLASQSPRRRELLETAGIDFEVFVSNADETVPEGTSPEDAALITSLRKAQAVKARKPDSVILAADTTVVLGNEIMGKPANADDAASMLRRLSGKTHTVMTGVCVLKGEQVIQFVEKTLVTFYELTDSEINTYVATGEPMDKAGAYGIQGRGCCLVRGIEGDYFNVVGLPVAHVTRELRKISK